jgi:hypothetical protein
MWKGTPICGGTGAHEYSLTYRSGNSATERVLVAVGGAGVGNGGAATYCRLSGMQEAVVTLPATHAYLPELPGNSMYHQVLELF